MVGKYTDLHDAYKSVQEALIHGGIANDVGRRRSSGSSSDRFTDQEAAGQLLAGYDGLLVPGGFGVRGVEGMIEAIRWAREHDLPFFGICLGLQVAIIEFARNVCGLPDANSTEFEPECGDAGHRADADRSATCSDLGGTMRLGAYPARLRPGSQGGAGLRHHRDQRAAPAPLRGQQRLPRRARRARAAALAASRPTAGWSR